jgi:hypothetical protein
MSDGAGYDCDACPRYRGACEALRLHEQRIAELERDLARLEREARHTTSPDERRDAA